uniref:RCK N-terminal domain-containing protein n=1 Tax=Strigamia maritima TaxID=126957 RepID=T1JA22_STRMM
MVTKISAIGLIFSFCPTHQYDNYVSQSLSEVNILGKAKMSKATENKVFRVSNDNKCKLEKKLTMNIMRQNGRLVQFPRPPRDRTLLLDVLEVEDLTVPTPRSSGYRPQGPPRRLSFAARALQQLPFMSNASDDPYADDRQREEAGALNSIFMTIDEDQLQHVMHTTTPKEAWNILKTENQGQKDQLTVELMVKLTAVKMGKTELVTAYLNCVNSLVQELKALGSTVDNKQVCVYVLRGLTTMYAEVSRSCEAQGTDITMANIKRLLKMLCHNVDVQHSSDVDVQHSSDVDVQHSSDVDVQHSSDVDMQHSSDVDVQHSSDVDMQHSTDVDMQHSSDVDMQHSSDVDMQHHQIVKVELFAHERSTRDSIYLFCFKNKSTHFIIQSILFVLKVLTCVLYVIRGIIDDAANADCYGCKNEPCRYLEDFLWPKNCSNMEGNSEKLCWSALLWVQNPDVIWGTQVAIAIWTLLQTTFLSILKYKGHMWKVIDFYYILELITSVPLLVTLFSTPLRNLFIPIFLNCWIAKKTMENAFIYHKLSGSASPLLSQHLLFVTSTLVCLAFTAICGFEHIQRVGCRRYNFFESSYFVAITLTTVGYGDLFPDVWLSKLYMVLMILIALAVMPKKFESLAFSWMERQKIGGSYNKSKRRPDRHVVVCISQLNADTLTDFLNEFYSYRQLMEVSVVILSSSELDIETRQVLLSPIWTQKVVYIKGSSLKDSDLKRARIKEADACFIIGIDNTIGKSMADEHTILRCWAVKDFAPTVPQYVQIFRPENKVHVKFAEYVVCEDEMKYAMLAYNCICPGASTMITLLLHTSRGEEGQSCKDEWLKLYGKGSGNEVYHVLLKDSLIFNDYEGKTFTYTSLHTHRRYGVVLIGVKCTHDSRDSFIKLNPGPSHTMRFTDICFYLSISREENMNFSQIDDKKETPRRTFTSKLQDAGSVFFRRSLAVKPISKQKQELVNHIPHLVQNREISHVAITEQECDDDLAWLTEIENCEIIMSYPRVSPFIGASPTLVHIRKHKKRHCCMKLTAVCEHCSFVNAQQYHWPNREIILVAEQATSGIYNFIVPLRAHYLSKASLQPIILLLETAPDTSFLDAVSWFPLIYYTCGSIQCLDDLLIAGVVNAGTVVVANRECDDVSAGEEDLADSNTIVAVQSVFEFFPRISITTELSQSSNMRFLHFQASNAYSMYLAEIEKAEKENGSNIPFMFRLQFASGRVFSANMMDTLLYQAYVKDYIINIIRLMLGIDQAPGSAYLTSIKVTSKELKLITYGNLFAELCASGGDIPICIYRTQVDVENVSSAESSETDVFSLDSWESFTKDVHATEINNLIASRMESLGINATGYEYVEPEQKTTASYVIINPSCDLNLESDDIIFVLRPNQLKTYPSYNCLSSRIKGSSKLGTSPDRNAHGSRTSLHTYTNQEGKAGEEYVLHQKFSQTNQLKR